MKFIHIAAIAILATGTGRLFASSAGGGGGGGSIYGYGQQPTPLMIEVRPRRYYSETTFGVGAVVPDNENVESAAAGKLDAQINAGLWCGFGLAATQTGNFKQQQLPGYLQPSAAPAPAPQPFAAPKFTPHHHHHHTNITNIYTQPSAPPASLPRDYTERSFWAAEPYFELHVPMSFIRQGVYVRPYIRAYIGAAGVKTASNETLYGLSRGLGGGVLTKLGVTYLGLEAQRRHIDADRETYGNWQYVAKAGWEF